MFKIFIHTPTNNPAYNYYRIHSPINHCKVELYGEKIELTFGEELDLTADCIVLHGMPDPYQIKRIEKIHCNSQLWWSVDDAMFDVPITNPVYNLISPTEVSIMKIALDMAQGIIVTTQNVANYYGHPEKSHICPNLIDLKHYGKPRFPKTFNRYGWIAGNSHYEDAELISFLPIEHPDKEFIFFSCLPDELTKFERKYGSEKVTIRPNRSNVGWIPTYDMPQYHKVCKNLKLDCGLAPLQSTLFNSCKSNLKWLEYSALGCPTIASNCEPYSKSIKHEETGILVDEDWNEWLDNIDVKMSENAHTEIEDNWSWQSEKCRDIWLNTFRKMVKC